MLFSGYNIKTLVYKRFDRFLHCVSGLLCHSPMPSGLDISTFEFAEGLTLSSVISNPSLSCNPSMIFFGVIVERSALLRISSMMGVNCATCAGVKSGMSSFMINFWTCSLMRNDSPIGDTDISRAG